MNRLPLFIFVLLLLSFSTPLHAQWNAIGGTEITYRNIGKDSLRVTLVYYKSCAVTTAPVAMAIEVSSTCGSNKFNLSQVGSAQNITPSCIGGCNTCTGGSNCLGFGIEKLVYQTIVTIGGNCCVYTLGVVPSSGFGVLTSRISIGATGWQSMYNYAQVNKCNAAVNNSPEFNNDPFLIGCTADNVWSDQSVSDIDTLSNGSPSDSLVYSFVSPESKNFSGGITNFNYNAPYTVAAPFSFFGFPTTTANWPRGFRINPQTGLMRFRPTKEEESFICIQVDEYRNGNFIGRVRRDNFVAFVSCTDNVPPTVSSNDCRNVSSDRVRIRLCATKPSTLRFCTADRDRDDLVTLEIEDVPSGAVVNRSRTTDTRITATIDWTPSSSLVGEDPSEIILTARDRGCPLNAMDRKTILLDVEQPFEVLHSITRHGCDSVTLKAEAKDKNVRIETYRWYVDGEKLSEDSVTSFTIDSAGTYYIHLDVQREKGCQYTIHDSLVETNFTPLVLEEAFDSSICQNERLRMNAKVVSGNGKYTYSWQDGISKKTFLERSIKTDTFYAIEVTDSLNCVTRDTFRISVYEPIAIKSDNIFPFCGIGDSVELSATPDSGEWRGAGVRDGYFSTVLSGFGTHEIIYSIEDENMCYYADTQIVPVSFSPDVEAGPDDVLCQQDAMLELTGTPSGGWWAGVGVVSQGGKFFFDPNQAQIGQNEVFYVKFHGSGCSGEDSRFIRVRPSQPVNAGRDTALCINGDPIVLGKVKDSLEWLGRGVSAFNGDYVFYPSDAGSSRHRIVLSKLSPNGCRSNDTAVYIVGRITKVDFDARRTGVRVPFRYEFYDSSEFSLQNMGVNRWYWTFGLDTIVPARAQNPVRRLPSGRFYDIKLVVEDTITGCKDSLTKVRFINTFIVGASTHSSEMVQVYPNPASDHLNVRFYYNLEGSKRNELVLQDLMGREVLRVPLSSSAQEHQIPISLLSPGSYIYSVRSDDDIQAIGRLQKR